LIDKKLPIDVGESKLLIERHFYKERLLQEEQQSSACCGGPLDCVAEGRVSHCDSGILRLKGFGETAVAIYTTAASAILNYD